MNQQVLPEHIIYRKTRQMTAQKMKFPIKNFFNKCDQCDQIY